jgi:hypothetical protein
MVPIKLAKQPTTTTTYTTTATTATRTAEKEMANRVRKSKKLTCKNSNRKKNNWRENTNK